VASRRARSTRGLVGIQPWLAVALSKNPSGVNLNLTLGVDDDEEPALRVTVETKAVLAAVTATIWLVGCLRVEERMGCEAEVEATLHVNLVAFSLIPLKLQIL